MSRKWMAYAIGALSLLLSTRSQAQSSLQATVPFAFTAGNVEVPAGDYLIRQKGENHFVSIVDLKSGKVTYAFISESQSLPIDASAKLLFHCYGSQHYLAAIWTGGGGTARMFPVSDQEKLARAQLVAGKATENPTELMVAMK